MPRAWAREPTAPTCSQPTGAILGAEKPRGLKATMRRDCDSLIKNEADFRLMIKSIEELLTNYIPLVDLPMHQRRWRKGYTKSWELDQFLCSHEYRRKPPSHHAYLLVSRAKASGYLGNEVSPERSCRASRASCSFPGRFYSIGCESMLVPLAGV